MLTRFFNFQTKNISANALILGVSYFLSALLGLFRDRLLAGNFGAGLQLDVYFAAFRIPDFVYNILILGGLTIAFLPLFSEYFSKDKNEAWRMTNHLLNAFLLFLISISLVLFIITPWLISWIFPGFGKEAIKLAIPLTRLLFLSPIFFGISNLFSGILHYFNRFFVYSLAPVLYNLGIIFGIMFLSPRFGIFGVGLGVILGAFLHMAIQIPSAINCGFSYKALFNFKYPALKRIFYLMMPRVFGVAAQQINLIIITGIASTITAGSIAIFNFSNNLQGLPVGIIGVSFAVAVFPTLSRTFAENQKKEFFQNFSLVFRRILLFIIPVSILLFLLRTPIVSLIYKTGKFNVEDVQTTSACLGIFAFSIFAQSLIPLLARGFFSLQDTKTPTLVTFTVIALNIVLAFFFIQVLSYSNSFSSSLGNFFGLEVSGKTSVIGLPLAFSLTAILQFILLFILFRRKTKITL
jgi:putative peptidoglycan lipid II flippase